MQAISLWDSNVPGAKAIRVAWSGGNVLWDTNYVEVWQTEQNTNIGIDSLTVSTQVRVDSTAVNVQGSVHQASGAAEDLASFEMQIYKLP